MNVTRLAPSPTGALHLGNARTFLVNWLIARQRGWKIVLRIEDLDGPRIKPAAAQQAIDDLNWLGIDWEEGPIVQSTRTHLYREAADQLIKQGRAYWCVCSRKEVESAASAPHAEDAAPVYPGTCRGRFTSAEQALEATGRRPALRFLAPDETVRFNDEVAGPQALNVAERFGDFVIAKADGTAAYQLSVVVDDAAMNVNHIVRGDDLRDSTPRQILLYRALGLSERIPQYCHLPLVVGEDGRRLAKRHGDTRIALYREMGVRPERLLALLARWCGLHDCGDEITLETLLNRFDLARLPRERVVFTPAADAWLRLGAAESGR